jgi:hypothetical protein
VVGAIEPERDLNKEFFSARLETIVQVAVRVVEQERGLELQVSCPESTLATMLPIVIVIEAASALKRELFFAIFEAKPSELVKALARPLVSEAAKVREPVRNIISEFFSAGLEAEVSDPLVL